MNTTRTSLILTLVGGVIVMSACRDKQPCTDCGEDVAVDDDGNRVPDMQMTDLPCGGADLMTDNLNCGTCGHECIVGYPDTQYEAGGCKAGVCGPGGWTDCIPDIGVKNCAEICIAINETCVPNGCAGLTGMLFPVNIDGWGCDASSYEPVATLSGCDEPIPWMDVGENPRHVQCCCDFFQ